MPVDYLRAVLPDTPETWAFLGEWLGEATGYGGGWHGWYDRSCGVLDGGIIASCSRPERAEIEGVCVDLPGKACACLGDKLIPFLRECTERGRISRIDFAIDDHEGRLTFDRIMEANASGALVSRWHRGRKIEEFDVGSPETDGWTIAFGRRSSAAYLRFYDKAAEQRQKRGGREGTPEAPAGTPAVWIRCELECKSKFADALSREYLERGSEAVLEQLTRRIRFIDTSGPDTNKWRAPMASWWASFVGSVKAGVSLVAGEVIEATVQRLASWVERQCAPALATILMADGGDLGRLLGILDRGRGRLRPKHRVALALAGV